MHLLLSFSPFIAFAVLSGPLGAVGALIAGAAIAGALMVHAAIAFGALRTLEIGTLLLFLLLAGWTALTGGDLPVAAVKMWVDIGLVVIALGSLALRRPFTLDYARHQAPERVWNNPLFLHANMVITAVWAVAFAVMAFAAGLVAYVPGVPVMVGTALLVAAMAGAAAFTFLYPRHLRAAAARLNASAAQP